MSRTTFTPFREVVAHTLQVREHRFLFTCNHPPKHARFQAPLWHAHELVPKPRTPSNCRTVSLTMTGGERKIAARNFSASSAAPHAINEMQRVAACPAPAHEASPNSALAKLHRRHRPLL